MGHHRAELIQRLDHVLGQLDRGSEYLKQQNPDLGRYDLWKAKRRYRKLKDILLEVERRMSSSITTPFHVLTLHTTRSFSYRTIGLSLSPFPSSVWALCLPRVPPHPSLTGFATFVGCVISPPLRQVTVKVNFWGL